MTSDTPALRAFLADRFGPDEGRFVLERVAGGQSNPTFFLTHGPHRMVLRTRPLGPTLPGAHAIDREFRVLTALHPTGVPVPRPILFCDDRALTGAPFYLMQRLDGRIFPEAALPDLPQRDRRAITLAMADALAALHRIRPGSVGLADFGKPGNYFARQIARWSRAYHDSPGPRLPDLDRLADWLCANLPPDDGADVLAHGDFRIGNLMFHPSEPRVIAILDWELATLGHPLADLGFAAMAWHTAPDEYGGLLGLDLAALNLPTRTEFEARYHETAPPGGPLTAFHIAFALFRFAVIFIGIADRARSGSAADPGAARLAPLAACFAARARALVTNP